MENRFFKDSPKGIFVVIIFAIIGYLCCNIWLFTNIKFSDGEQSITVLDSVIKKEYSGVKTDTLNFTNDKLKTVDISNADLFFNRNPNFLVWMVLILITVTLAAAAFPVFIWQIIRLKEKYALTKWHIVQSTLFAFLTIVFIALFQWSSKGFYVPGKIIDDFGILLKHGYVVPGIVLVTFILQVPILNLIFLIGISAKKITFDVKNKRNIEQAVFQFSGLNQLLNSSLQMLALMIVLSVLTTSAIEHSIKSALVITSIDIFPKEISYVYGMFFSLFLAIIYVPSFIHLRNCQNKIKHDFYSEADTDDITTHEWYEKIVGKINAGNSALDSLKLSLTVLAPLLSSFLPEQFRFFG